MGCCICGKDINDVHWAIRDYDDETYLQWVWRHIKTLFKMRSHRYKHILPVCDNCYEMLRSSQLMIDQGGK